MTWQRPLHQHATSFWRWVPESASWVGKCRLCHQELLADDETAAELELAVSQRCSAVAPTIRIAVTGGRAHTPSPVEMDSFWRIWRGLATEGHPIELLHGDARGVDRYVAQQARQRGIKVRAFPADWNKHGKAAGPLRNRQMLQQAHALIAFLQESGPGTASAIRIAEDLGITIQKIGA